MCAKPGKIDGIIGAHACRDPDLPHGRALGQRRA
jgi:hypothetical protein